MIERERERERVENTEKEGGEKMQEGGGGRERSKELEIMRGNSVGSKGTTMNKKKVREKKRRVEA